MYESVTERLNMFGYEIQEGDEPKIIYSIGLITENIRNFCNLYGDLPEELKYYSVDKICGDFLKTKLMTGNLSFEDIDFDAPTVQSITEGDTSVTYAVGASDSEAQKMTKFIDSLNATDKNILYRFRRFEW